jgi:hypothetical protein
MTQPDDLHVVMFSGGITSWAVAQRVAEAHGTERLVLLFADTQVEDEDLYRFNRDVERDLGLAITAVTDGRTPQQVGRDRKHLGNTQIANCSHLLKQKPCRDWLTANMDPARTNVYVGIDWTELHRLPAIERAWAPWTVDAPLTRPPYADKRQHIAAARARGLVEPRLYALGFEHNNCGGACVKAGQAQWAHLLRTFPDRFASWESYEQEMRAELGDVAILRDRSDGQTRPLPLAVLRRRIEASPSQRTLFDTDDWGGCGCFTAEVVSDAA